MWQRRVQCISGRISSSSLLRIFVAESSRTGGWCDCGWRGQQLTNVVEAAVDVHGKLLSVCDAEGGLTGIEHVRPHLQVDH